MQPSFPPPPPPRVDSKGTSVLVVVLAIVGGGLLLVVVLVVLAISGFSRYMSSAKTAEAVNAVGQLSASAVSAYERETMIAGSPSVSHGLCDSASRPVPQQTAAIAARKYMSSPSDWQFDRAAEKGFYCLRFTMDIPQYYQYDYQRSGGPGGSFKAIARGDLDGDGALSEFSQEGRADGSGGVKVSHPIRQVDPTE